MTPPAARRIADAARTARLAWWCLFRGASRSLAAVVLAGAAVGVCASEARAELQPSEAPSSEPIQAENERRAPERASAPELEADIVIRLDRPNAWRGSDGLRGIAGLVAGEEALATLDVAWAELLEGLGVEAAWRSGELLAGPLTIALDREEPASEPRDAVWRWAAVAPLRDGPVDTVKARIRGRARGSVAGRARFTMENGRYQATGVRAEDGVAALVVASTASARGDGDEGLFSRAVRWAAAVERLGGATEGPRVAVRFRTPDGSIRVVAAERDGGWLARLVAPAQALGLRDALQHAWTEAEAREQIEAGGAALTLVGSADLLAGLARLPSLLRGGRGETAATPGLGLKGGRFALLIRPVGERVWLRYRGACAHERRADGACVDADAAAAVLLRTLGADAGASRLAGRMPEVSRRQRLELGAGSLAHAAFGPVAVLRWGAAEGHGEGPSRGAGPAWWTLALEPLAAAADREASRRPGPGRGGFVRATAGPERSGRRVLSMGSCRPGLVPEALRGWLSLGGMGLGGEPAEITWAVSADDRARVRAEVVIDRAPGADAERERTAGGGDPYDR